ncbi:MAG: hypothetical protein HZA50_03975 [Planctomycetes bacterium]|nr:hypothetical protein [Planctomycetota bacterium]
MRSWGISALAGILWLLLFASSARPDGASDTAQEVFEKLYGAEVKKAITTPDKKDDVALAEQILNAARGLSNQPELLALMCDKAAELASKDPAGFQLAEDALRLLINKVPASRPAALDRLAGMKEKELQSAQPDSKLRLSEELIALLGQIADAKSQAGDMAGAIQTVNKAMGLAAANKSPTKDVLAARIRTLTERQKTAQDVANLQTKIKNDETDIQSRNQLIILLVTEMDDIKQAQDLITPLVNEQLKLYVPLAAKNIKDLADSVCQELGDWHYRLSNGATNAGKINVLRKAVSYYQAFISKHPAADMAKSTAELTLTKIQYELAALCDTSAVQDGTLFFFETFDRVSRQSQPEAWDMRKNGPDKVAVGPEKGNNVLALVTKDPGQPAYCERLIPLDPQWNNLTVTARLKGRNIKLGAGYPNGARLTLRVTDTTMKDYSWPIPAFAIYGDCDWKNMSITLNVPRGARYIRLEPGFMGGASGELYIDDIRIYANSTPVALPYQQGFPEGKFAKLDEFGIPAGWTADPSRVIFVKEADKSFLRLKKEPNEPPPTAITYVKVDPKWQAVRVTAQVRCSNFPPAVDYYFTSGRIMVFPEFNECVLAGRYPYSPPFKKDTNWTEFKYDLNLPKETYRLKIEIVMDLTPGVFDVADVKVEPIDKPPAKP